ncbi:MAG: hypothetical protein ACXWIU_09560 [Limisphaerales bacterium]
MSDAPSNASAKQAAPDFPKEMIAVTDVAKEIIQKRADLLRHRARRLEFAAYSMLGFVAVLLFFGGYTFLRAGTITVRDTADINAALAEKLKVQNEMLTEQSKRQYIMAAELENKLRLIEQAMTNLTNRPK